MIVLCTVVGIVGIILYFFLALQSYLFFSRLWWYHMLKRNNRKQLLEWKRYIFVFCKLKESTQLSLDFTKNLKDNQNEIRRYLNDFGISREVHHVFIENEPLINRMWEDIKRMPSGNSKVAARYYKQMSNELLEIQNQIFEIMDKHKDEVVYCYSKEKDTRHAIRKLIEERNF
ncbi:hypothetical protein ACMGD3_23940 [Lysinibacillus sphaericus]|uniref:hypothetical protein n=1 Tax=Lysinibacillus sphaericus TaxID=1421 RepID=UPI003F790990